MNAYRCQVCGKFISTNDGITTLNGYWVCDSNKCRTLNDENQSIENKTIIVNDFINLKEISEPGAIITIYDSPEDFKGKFIARLYLLDKPTPYAIIKNTLEELRDEIPSWMVPLQRQREDFGSIVEVFI